MKPTVHMMTVVICLMATTSWSQECHNNLITNPGFENGLTGWSNLTTSTVNLYSETQALNPAWVPKPASGNYVALWIANWQTPSITKREGLVQKLVSPISTGSGQYKLTFEYCCLNDCGGSGGNGVIMPRISVYGTNNPNNQPSSSATGSHTPSNMNLFTGLSTSLLATTTINKECGNELFVVNNPALQLRGTKYQFEATIDMNSINHNITHIFLTHSDDIIVGAEAFIGVDNFCLIKEKNQEGNCCQCCKNLEKENQELLTQLNKCCERNPRCCIKPKPKPSIGVLTPDKPKPTAGSGDDKCCMCCKDLEKENAEIKKKLSKCCRKLPKPTPVPSKDRGKG